MNLCIDSGNSSIKWGIFENGVLKGKGFSQNYDAEHWTGFVKSHGNIDKCIFCSVNNKDKEVRQALKDSVKSFIDFNHKTKIPLKNLYKTPETLGSDRLAACIGAWSVVPQGGSCLVIDLGTAVTFDVVTSGGEYTGGNIEAGLTMRLSSLNAYTSHLPLISQDDAETMTGLYGNDTNSAIGLGGVNGLSMEIICNIILTSEKCEVFTFLTGGNAKLFEKKLKSDIFAFLLNRHKIDLGTHLIVDDDILLKGLDKTLETNI